jgi:hypothetical protein
MLQEETHKKIHWNKYWVRVGYTLGPMVLKIKEPVDTLDQRVLKNHRNNF